MEPTTPPTAIPPAASDLAAAHFEALLALETDCWDVHQALCGDSPVDFVLLHVAGPADAFPGGHLPGAIYLHHSAIDVATLAPYPPDTMFVVYCAGPHCNGADRAAARIARLGRPVKKMLGGLRGWLDEGFELATTAGAGGPPGATPPGVRHAPDGSS